MIKLMLRDSTMAVVLGIICFAIGIGLQVTMADKETVVTSTPAHVQVPAHKEIDEIQVISLAELKSLLEENTPILIDVRDEDVFLRGHIPGALNYPLETYESFQKALLEELETSEHPIILYCGSKGCKDSQLMADKLAEAGIPKSRLLVYKGGWIDWAINRGKIETGPARSLVSG
jgi:phage shock protein E